MLNGSDLMFKNDRLYYCRRDWRLAGEIDERNVKNIGVNGYKSFFRPATNQEIKDWLEKQGEQKAKIVDFKAKDWYVSKVDGKIYNAKFMEEPLTNQKRRLEIEKAAMSATGIIEQEEWFIKGAEWSDKNPFCISSENRVMSR